MPRCVKGEGKIVVGCEGQSGLVDAWACGLWKEILELEGLRWFVGRCKEMDVVRGL